MNLSDRDLFDAECQFALVRPTKPTSVRQIEYECIETINQKLLVEAPLLLHSKLGHSLPGWTGGLSREAQSAPSVGLSGKRP